MRCHIWSVVRGQWKMIHHAQDEHCTDCPHPYFPYIYGWRIHDSSLFWCVKVAQRSSRSLGIGTPDVVAKRCYNLEDQQQRGTEMAQHCAAHRLPAQPCWNFSNQLATQLFSSWQKECTFTCGNDKLCFETCHGQTHCCWKLRHQAQLQRSPPKAGFSASNYIKVQVINM